MGGCSSTTSAPIDQPVRPGYQPSRGPKESTRTGSSGYTPPPPAPASSSNIGRTRGPSQDLPPRNRKPNSRRLDTVDFVEFKDKEKNVVELMLNNNKGLRMAEINFHDLKLQKIIGAGAFGEVIKGTYCGTPVVVKRMLRNKINEDNLRMFGDEIQLMMNLRHPNIVQVCQ